MGRIAAIDYGTVRVGLAISDERQIIAQPIGFSQGMSTLPLTAQKIKEHLAPYLSSLEAIVIGLPLMLNGKESPTSLQVRQLAKILEELFALPVILWDERLTSAQVERTLKEANMRRKQRTKHTDTLAAVAILQSYLN